MMLDYRNSDVFKGLVRQGMAERTVGAVGKAGMENAAATQEGRSRPQVAAVEGGQTADLKLVWNNPNMTKRAQRSTSAHLAIFE